MTYVSATVLIAGLSLSDAANAAPTTFSASGSNAGSIQSSVDSFRTTLGTLNANVAGSFGSGRREINWDGVPDTSSAPNGLPANFFNSTSPRGVVLGTPGTGFQVSASSASGTPVQFGNINATYPDLFQAFSPQRLFTAVGSNVVDVRFFVPGSATAALTRGFGSVFTDVDLANTSSVAFYDSSDTLLDTFAVPAQPGLNKSLSFFGADYGAAVVSRVRIVSGNAALGATETSTVDLVVMDDFIYGEPLAATISVPEPGTLAALATGLAGFGLAGVRRRRQRLAW